MLATWHRQRIRRARRETCSRIVIRDALFVSHDIKEVPMLKLKLIGTALIASVIATAIVVDTADARRGGGGGGVRAGGGFGGGGAIRGGGGLNRGGALAGSRIGYAGSLARVSGRPDLGRPGRPDVGLPGRPGDRLGWGWGGGWNGGGWNGGWPGYGWGWGAAALGAGLAYGAASSYCDPNYDPYCNGGYASYGYAPAYGSSYAPAYGAADAIAECARRFRSYDPASQTYLSYSGQRIQCPQ
jgi:BA14K-like protein